MTTFRNFLNPWVILCSLSLLAVVAAPAAAEPQVNQQNVFEDDGVIKIMSGEACDSRPGEGWSFPWPPYEFDSSIR